MRPFITVIMKAYGVPMNPSTATVWLGVMGVLANIMLLCLVRWMGKRRVYLISMIGTFTCCISLAVYGFLYLPPGWRALVENLNAEIVGHENLAPLILMIGLAFFTSLGVSAVPWMLLSEVFPFK